MSAKVPYIIDQVTEWLRQQPEFSFRVQENWIEAITSRPCGFPVRLEVHRDELIVSYGGWHEHFTSKDEAFRCFRFGLLGSCRVRTHRRGRFAYRWVLEFLDGDRWVEESETGLLIFPFWRKDQVEYFSNQDVIPPKPMDAEADEP